MCGDSGDSVSVGDGFGHNVMGSVDVGIPGGMGKGCMGVGVAIISTLGASMSSTKKKMLV